MSLQMKYSAYLYFQFGVFSFVGDANLACLIKLVMLILLVCFTRRLTLLKYTIDTKKPLCTAELSFD